MQIGFGAFEHSMNQESGLQIIGRSRGMPGMCSPPEGIMDNFLRTNTALIFQNWNHLELTLDKWVIIVWIDIRPDPSYGTFIIFRHPFIGFTKNIKFLWIKRPCYYIAINLINHPAGSSTNSDWSTNIFVIIVYYDSFFFYILKVQSECNTILSLPKCANHIHS